MNKYFRCLNCEHLQHTTTFGECAECGKEDLLRITKAEYDLALVVKDKPLSSNMSFAADALQKSLRQIVNAWNKCCADIAIRRAEPDNQDHHETVCQVIEAEKAVLERKYQSVRHAIRLLNGDAPLFIHHFEFGADQQASLHVTPEAAIDDVEAVWTQNRFDPEADGCVIIAATIKGEAGTAIYGIDDERRLIDGFGKETGVRCNDD